MATGMLAAFANTALDAALANYTWTKLHVGDPGAAGTANPATETTRKQVTWGSTSGGANSNTNTLTWTNVAASEDYTHFSQMTASTAGSPGLTGTVTANPVTAGDTFTVAVGDLDVVATLAS